MEILFDHGALARDALEPFQTQLGACWYPERLGVRVHGSISGINPESGPEFLRLSCTMRDFANFILYICCLELEPDAPSVRTDGDTVRKTTEDIE